MSLLVDLFYLIVGERYLKPSDVVGWLTQEKELAVVEALDVRALAQILEALVLTPHMQIISELHEGYGLQVVVIVLLLGG